MHGHPNHVTTFSNRNLAAVSAVKSMIGATSAHMVKYSITIIIYLALDLLAGGLIGPTKSISHLSNAYSVTCSCKCISSILDGFPTL
jgi:hypothetical protein